MQLRSTKPKKLAKSVHFTAVSEDALRKLRQDNLRAAYAEYSEKISAQGKAPRGFVQALAEVYGQKGQLFTYFDLKNFIKRKGPLIDHLESLSNKSDTATATTTTTTSEEGIGGDVRVDTAQEENGEN